MKICKISESSLIVWYKFAYLIQGFSQLPESGEAGIQIVIKVGGQESEIQMKYEQSLPKISKNGRAVAPLVRNALW